MIVRRCWSLILSTGLILCVRVGSITGERWSRQVSNSEWIPLANPRSAQSQIRPNNPGNGVVTPGSSSLPHLPSLPLPPVLQEQYQQQLLQLQKTQENIQKLLILQEQLRAQQQLLQTQSFAPSGFSSPENDKQLLQQSSIPSASGLSSDVLVPPLPSSDALPPIYSAQNFLSQGASRFHQPLKANQNVNVKPEEFVNSGPESHHDGLREGQSPDLLGKVESIQENVKDFAGKQEKYRPTGKRVKGQTSEGISTLSENTENENEEVQLVYVPVETLAQQRGQPKRVRGQKQYPFRQQQQQQQQQHQQQQQQQYRLNEGVEQTTGDQDTFARDLLEQLEYVKEERSKEVTRMEDVEKALERKAQLEQEILRKEQELARQREEERRRKELEEIAKQRELERLREVREKQRLEELERRRIAEARAKEERRRQEDERRRQEEERRRQEEEAKREKERLAALERQKQLDIQRALEEQKKLEQRQQEEATTILPSVNRNQPDSQALPLIRNKQLHRQHITETSKPVKQRYRVRQRPKINEQPPTTTAPPSPNQPPLSVYMGGGSMAPDRVKITDVLKILKDAKTIAVLDTVGPNTPKVFVGPTNLDPPPGYTKFDLPYLSSIDHNRVERKVDKLPFFVAPLSFDPPPGYSKIPFPAPHIGSVVVNTIDASSPEPDTPEIPSPTPIIEPNSYIDGTGSDLGRIDPTTLGYEHSTTAGYTQESSSTPKYDSSYSTISTPSGGSRYRFRQSYGDNNSPAVIDTVYRGEPSIPTGKAKQRPYYNEDTRSVTPTLTHDARLSTTAASYQEESVYSSTPNYLDHSQSTRTTEDPSTQEQDLAAQLALINRELAQQRDANNNKNSFNEHHNEYAPSNPRLTNSFQTLLPPSDANDVRGSIGPTQYSLPAELPISPHLPGLVNSLLEKQTTIPTTTSTYITTTPAIAKTTTTTTTTTRPASTTYRQRSRHRGRVVPTRPPTTTAATTSVGKTSVDRPKRPYSRTRSSSRYTTTTESYNDSPAYEPTKAKHSGTTQKYNPMDHHNRPRSQKHRNNEKTAYQSETYESNYNIQAHQAATFEHSPPDESATTASTDPYSQLDAHTHNSRQQEQSSNLNAFSQENYPTTSITTSENYPPPRETTPNYDTSQATEDYSRIQNYPQNYPQEGNYPTAFDSQVTGLDQTVLEKAPVNGFNYQAQNSETRNQPTVQKSKDYSYYADKLEGTEHGLSGTIENQRTKVDETAQQYSPAYDVAPVQSHLNYPPTGDHGSFGQVEDGKVDESSVVADPNEQPIFVPLPEKQEVYDLLTPPTERPLAEQTTQSSTTTEATPVVVRQRVRGRISSRTHSDSAVQTRPRGSQDEYVRLSAVNQDSTRSSGTHRHRTKSRTRPHSQVQTSGYEYVKIQAGSHRQRPAVQTTTTTTTTTPRPTTTTTTEPPLEEDIDYGFIRPPNFQPVNPVDNRFNPPPVTYKPILPQIQQQVTVSSHETALDYNPPSSHSPKNRPKYHTTNRRPSIKSTNLPITTPATTTTTENIPPATINPDNSVYTVRPKYKPEDIKQSRSRSRIRRPGRKRVSTTTSTESVLDAHNEVPLEGNYPRILQPLPEAVGEQQPLYDENFEGLAQFGETYNQPDQSYKQATENYPQDFVLNFGALPPQTQEEYDQTQLASNAPEKYSTRSMHQKSTTSSDSHLMTGDIYGAESQWSTKLSRTSFQPSFAANYANGESSEARKRGENAKETADIITARPESSMTFLVSSDFGSSDETKSLMSEEESMAMATTVFGKKTTTRDHTESSNAATATNSTPRRKQKVTSLESYDGETWLRSKSEEQFSARSAEKEDAEKIPKKSNDPVAVRKTNRRKRVRVRVRPIVDDFVTAESQHINSAVNSLTHDQYKYNPTRQSKPTGATRSSNDGTRRSVLQDFLEEMLKNDDVALPVLATSTTTVLPVNAWLTSTPMMSPTEEEDTTVYKPSRTTTNAPTTTTEEIGKTVDPEESLRTTTQYFGTRITPKDSTMKEHTEHIKQPTTPNIDSQTVPTDFNDSQTTSNDLNTVDSLETTPIVKKLEATTMKSIDTTTENSLGDKKKRSEKTNDDNDIAYPKNHRAKWSEVKYPSDPSIALNHSLFSSWNYEKKGRTVAGWNTTTPATSSSENDTEVKIISDYVQAVFDDLKNAGENREIDGGNPNSEENNTINSSKNSSGENDVTTNSPLETISIGLKKETSPPERTTTMNPQTEESSYTTIIAQNVEESSPTVIPDTTVHEIVTTAETMVTVTPSDMSTSTTTARTTTIPTVASTEMKSKVQQSNTTETILGKVLRTSTTTKVSHMTEICYRGRCVMTKPDREIRLR